MLAEFKYGGVPAETFGAFWDQRKPNRLFYHFVKDVFPFAYKKYMVAGNWFGPRALSPVSLAAIRLNIHKLTVHMPYSLNISLALSLLDCWREAKCIGVILVCDPCIDTRINRPPISEATMASTMP